MKHSTTVGSRIFLDWSALRFHLMHMNMHIVVSVYMASLEEMLLDNALVYKTQRGGVMNTSSNAIDTVGRKRRSQKTQSSSLET